MTHQSQTNGASLEDCHTNFFALTDLCGIKWRKLVQVERLNASSDPLDDPVLRSYSKCLAVDILCVWRRVAAPKPDPDPANFLELSLQQPTSVTHPPLSLTAAKELWIFWYGEEPDLTDLVAPELLKSSDGCSHGSWESGLSYECRSLLFKALHNLIERCLLSRDVVRLGRWFVQPASSGERTLGRSSMHLSYSFAFFVHGDSTVCASMDIREHPPVRPITMEHLTEAQAASQQNADVKPRQVILAPYGLAATLTGQSFRNIDPQTEKVLNDWSAFYPLHNKDSGSNMPPIVEVMSGGIKMRYPTKYVLVTDLDDFKSNISSNNLTNGIHHNGSSSNSSKLSCKENTLNHQQNNNNLSSSNCTNTNLKQNKSTCPVSASPTAATSCVVTSKSLISDNPTNDLGNPLSMHIPLKNVTVLPERVWQDCITSEATVKLQQLQLQQQQSHEGNNENASGAANKLIWEITNPLQKMTCHCLKSLGNLSDSSIPNDGPPSYSRTPHSVADSLPIPSVGSPASAAPSPMLDSALSQASVPPADQLLPGMSPHPQSIHTPMSVQPTTPSLQEQLDKNTPAATPTDQLTPKCVPPESPYTQTNLSSIEPPQQLLSTSSATPNPSTGSNNGGNPAGMTPTSTSGASGVETPGKLLENVKMEAGSGPYSQRPDSPKPCISMSLLKRPVLSSRDYETLSDDYTKPRQLLYDYSSWEAWMNHPVKRFKPNDDKAAADAKRSQSMNLYADEIRNVEQLPEQVLALPNNIMAEAPIKTETGKSDTENGVTIKTEPADDHSAGNLFTIEGLQPSYKDLDQIFDNSDDASNEDVLQMHTPPASNKSPGTFDDNKRTLCGSHNTGILGTAELSKMFPTPPSLEHHPNCSPYGSGISDLILSEYNEGPKIKQEIYPNLGSPTPETIEDWSYVYQPPMICKFVGSSKYAPLPNLPSQTMIPSGFIYKPSWQQQQQPKQAPASKAIDNKSAGTSSSTATDSSNALVPASMSSSNPKSVPPPRQHTPNPSQAMSQGPLSRPPSLPNTMGGAQGGFNPAVMGMRPRMSPISPAMMQQSGNFGGNTPGSVNSPMTFANRTPIPPPPPYDQAVASPATSTSSYLNHNRFSNDPGTPSVTRSPEANALLVNILLYDTALNIFRDHNFNSCTLCVCNADGKKSVGNIRGSDSGIYLPLPNTSFSSALQNGNFLMDSPANGQSSHSGGYVDDDPIDCKCGFSAVVNRRLGHRSGLFYEDEMEITGLAEDPAGYKKTSLLQLLMGRARNDGNSSLSDLETIPLMIMDLLRDQCCVIQNCSSSVMRAIRNFKSIETAVAKANAIYNVLEFTDAQEIITLALEQSRCSFEATQNPVLCKMDLEPYGSSRRFKTNIVNVHKWPFYRAGGPHTNLDIVRIMKSMQPLLQDAFHKKCTTRLWDAPYTVQGPLTWRQFHRLAGRGTGQCEPQPIPSVVVGHEKDWLSVAPYAIQHWDKLLLEPYSYPRDIAYVVLCPDNDYIVNRVKMYFKELSTTYEMCRLGKHAPIRQWDGIWRVGAKTNVKTDQIDDWFGLMGNSKTAETLKLYAQACQNLLTPYLCKVPGDRTLLDPPDPPSKDHKERPMPSPMPPPHTPEPSGQSSSTGTCDKAPSTPKSEQEGERDTLNASNQSTHQAEPLSHHDTGTGNPPHIVIYLVEPFTCGSDSTELQRLACLSLLRCYSNILASVPESIKANISVQIISQESIIELGRSRSRIRFSDHMRYLALSIFSQSRRMMIHTNNIKSLTGFGTAAGIEDFLKHKEEKQKIPYKLYSPPYILSSQHERLQKTESFGQASIEQQSSVMYCNYCLSEDQSWLLAVATDDRGELLETATINIDIPNRTRRKKASARRTGLQKLMDFILGVISQSTTPWHLVIGRIGRIGHGELKGWSWLLSKQNLVKESKQLKDLCKQCSLMYPNAVPSILSACLITLEPDSALRIMPDQFTPDERFSQISMQSPLSTPQDVTCSHILVFPISAVAQSYTNAFKETQEPGVLDDDDLFAGIEDGGDEDMDSINNLGDIFDGWGDANDPMPQSSPTGHDRIMDTGLDDNTNRMSVGIDGSSCGQTRNGMESENVGQVLQQPLALGYLVSTAPTGRMPSWFWSSCPHLENVCPVFLRTALHLHCSNIQLNNEEDSINPQPSATGHPLDSPLTADVLRYILEGYNVLSWLALDSNTHDRLSCLPIHVQVLMQLYHMIAALA
ncbi:mediator of RNA polymerase II transcription subunit 13 isoform X2 [Culicoides brevitarsis]|uniref:mediator of RNA polymerase II transcription subunit 13 isoform X2 n=1 Tax=Culicoides brevitarsis TaxID=469753 RepID=UPI00307CBEB1